MKDKNRVYVDYSATTPADERVVGEATPFFSSVFGNPSSTHKEGRRAREAVEDARAKIAKFLNCDKDEIILTSGGTEAENLAIKGIAFGAKKGGNHIIISAVEHNSVKASAEYLMKHGFDVSFIPVDKKCMLDLDVLEREITEKTILVSVMLANNEVGTIEPIEKITSLIKKKNAERRKGGSHSQIYFHTDAEAASFYLCPDVKKLGVDSLSINGSKMYSLKGAGALFVKNGVPMATQISGGGQERLLRGGTENVPSIVALGYAVSLAEKERKENTEHVLNLKNLLTHLLEEEKIQFRLNTHKLSLPGVANITFFDYSGENLAEDLDKNGISASQASACSSNKDHPPHVLPAMGLSDNDIRGSVRFSLGKKNTEDDIRAIVEILKKILR